MKKIAIFQSDLNIGGISKSLINFVNYISKLNCIIDLFLFDVICQFDNQFNENVNIIKIERPIKALRYMPYLITYKFFNPSYDKNRRYDISIDYNSYWNECAIGSQKVNADKYVMWIHNDVMVKRHYEFKYRLLWSLGKKKIDKFDEFVAVSEGVKQSFVNLAKGLIKEEKVRVIENLIDIDDLISKSNVNIDFEVKKEKYNLVCVGNLVFQKGFDILLKLMEQLVKKNPNIHLYIIGSGTEMKSLDKLCKKLNLNQYVTFLGKINNPFPYMKQMDGFILMSRYEGQGMVIWEAKALGLDIYIPKRLEKYNSGIKGFNDDELVYAIIHAIKKVKKYDYLYEYTFKNENETKRLIGV